LSKAAYGGCRLAHCRLAYSWRMGHTHRP
jgi:hypothetical protein